VDNIGSRRALINQKKQELKKRYGQNPILFSSGRGIDLEKEYQEKMRININRKVLEECLPKNKWD